jgi:hypothetical protein
MHAETSVDCHTADLLKVAYYEAITAGAIEGTKPAVICAGFVLTNSRPLQDA